MDIIFMDNEKEMTEKGIQRGFFVDFLHEHLGQFGDTKAAIDDSINYAFSDAEGKGGFLAAITEDQKMLGALIMLKSGMSDYIPENILLYVAVDSSQRGRGIGRKLIDKCIERCDGNVKLHVEYENPAKRLYERIGFQSKYAEMRFNR